MAHSQSPTTLKGSDTERPSSWLDATLLGAFSVIFVLLPVNAFLTTWLGSAIGPLLVWKSWKEIVLLGLVPLIGLYCFRYPKRAQLLWRSPLNKLIALYFAWTIVLLPFDRASFGAVIAGALMDLRFFAFFLLAQLIMTSSHPFGSLLRRRLPVYVLWCGIVLGVLALLQVSVLPKDLLTHFGYNKATTIAPIATVDNKPNVLRAFVTLRGPNELGAYLLMPLAFAVDYLWRRRLRLLSALALGSGLLGLLLSGSRSAWLGALLVVAMMGFTRMPKTGVMRWTKRLAIPAIVVLVGFLWLAAAIPSLRLAVYHSSAKDANPSLLAGSTDQHGQATLYGMGYILRHPFGTGPGSAGPASFYNTKAAPLISEDYYVQIGEELGVVGLALLIAIIYLAARSLIKSHTAEKWPLLAALAGLLLINLFLHGWADDTTAMTWWGMAGLYLTAGLALSRDKSQE